MPLKQLPEVPMAVPPELPEARDAAQAEARVFELGRSSADLRREAARNEHNRSERFRDHFETIAIIALWGIAFVFVIVGLIWFWHLVMPLDRHWLDQDGVSRLQNFVTGGIIATIAGGHIKKRLS